MVIFHCYVSSPEGISGKSLSSFQSLLLQAIGQLPWGKMFARSPSISKGSCWIWSTPTFPLTSHVPRPTSRAAGYPLHFSLFLPSLSYFINVHQFIILVHLFIYIIYIYIYMYVHLFIIYNASGPFFWIKTGEFFGEMHQVIALQRFEERHRLPRWRDV